MAQTESEWHYALTSAAPALNSKGEGAPPLSQLRWSPVSIRHCVLAAVRVRQYLRREACWIFQGQHRCPQNHWCRAVHVDVCVQFEDAIFEGRHVVGVAVHFANFFDDVPTAIALAVLEYMGMNARTLEPLNGMCASVKRRLQNLEDLWAHCSAQPTVIMQGCSLCVPPLDAMSALLRINLKSSCAYPH